ncbi:non-ribosomal peptide synthetase [Streptomyces yaizuensis]|uniref:Non-ribosomal peptide synthetase n=1 Tax=Streptomyces yaizuensis TaxID=2989713 RepID=A0ABQ5NQK3_9ACTN|nr:non-ribosomal peptide synthetase [Streptomyces sp. YSPA8]GLF92673.1 non-ribosomal peptide synthetase [Streptomyces sp. YSPA8]
MPDLPTGPPWPSCGLYELIARQADRTPAREAVRCGPHSLNYRELIGAAQTAADRLVRRGAGPGDRIAVTVDRSADLPVALLAVLRSGAAFVPVDPAYPPERQEHMLRDAGALLTVTNRRCADRVRTPGVLVLDEEEPGAPAGGTPEALRRSAGPEDLAYLMYTSGSTGRPKGVAVDHRCLVKGVLAMASVVRPGPDDVWLALTSASFDPVLVELFLPLMTGGSVVMAEEQQILDGHALGELLDGSGADVLQATPLIWSMLLDGGWRGGLRVALCGGEPLTPSLAAALSQRSREVWNIYGPTETTIWSTAHRVTPADQGVVPVGRPLPDTEVHLLDGDRRPVVRGERGEVWIGGGGVARGYAGQPALTAERFVPDPFGPPGGRLYRTGDLGRQRPDGTLELLGRADHQVKIRGHRVEPGEIESWLAEEPSVAEAVVLPRQDGDQLRLVAYVRPQRGAVCTEARLREHAEIRLPRPMLPAAYLMVDTWPRTPNGKIDRRALPEPPARATGPATGPGDGGDAAPDRSTDGSTDGTVRTLAGIWQEVLSIGTPPAPGADFFALGGTSLDIMRMVTSVRARFGVRLNAARMMRATTLADQAALVGAAVTAAAPAPEPAPEPAPDTAPGSQP